MKTGRIIVALVGLLALSIGTTGEAARKANPLDAGLVRGKIPLVKIRAYPLTVKPGAAIRGVRIPTPTVNGSVLDVCKWTPCTRPRSAQTEDEIGYHFWYTFEQESKRGEALFGSYWYVRWFVNAAKTRIVRVEKQFCQDYQYGADAEWNCLDRMSNGGAGGAQTPVKWSFGYRKQPCPSNSCGHWEYRYWVDAWVTADGYIYGQTQYYDDYGY